MEPSTTGWGGWAAVKLALAFGLPAAVATILGLLIMPPRTAAEFKIRIISTVSCSLMFGPLLAGALLSWQPGLMETLTWLAQHGSGDDPLIAKFYLLGPCMLMAGLPAWWVLGAYMRWMASMREKGLLAWLGEVRGRLLGWRRGGEG